MGATTKISWSNSTFNPWLGCEKVSPACKFCYAETTDIFRDWSRDGVKHWGPGSPRYTMKTTWNYPGKWNRAAELAGYKQLVFCASLADVFEDHPQLPELRERLWTLIESTPNLIYQPLTKRPENIMPMMPGHWRQKLPDNIWIMTSVEDQEWFDKRWPHLKNVPARVHGFSCEPLLGPIDFGKAFDGMAPNRIWVITGGEHESKEHARRTDAAWFRSLRDQCIAKQIPFFFKQWGNYREDGSYSKDYKFNELDGRIWEQFPDGHIFRNSKYDDDKESGLAG